MIAHPDRKLRRRFPHTVETAGFPRTCTLLSWRGASSHVQTLLSPCCPTEGLGAAGGPSSRDASDGKLGAALAELEVGVGVGYVAA